MNELTTTIKSVRRVGQKAGKKPSAFFAVRGAWGRGRARQSNCDSNLSPLFVGGFPRSWTDFVKSMTERFRGQAWGRLPAIKALLLTPDISCSKSNSCSRLSLLHCTASALLPACYVQARPAAAPIFAKFGSAFSGFYLPAASKLYLLDFPGLSANCRLNRQIKMYRLRQSEMYHPKKSKVGHFALFFSSA